MRVKINGGTIELHQGDITLEPLDAIVNAANIALAGGGGVDGAIHRRGGPSIMRETDTKYPDGCPTGSAVISAAGNLAAKYVIHAVGPVWSGGHRGEAELLAAAYRRSFDLAAEHGCRSIALPALSTGAYRYPMDQAAQVALSTAITFFQQKRTVPFSSDPADAGSRDNLRGGQDELGLIRFVLFDAGAYGAFAATLERLTAAAS